MSVSYGGDSITFADSSTISSGWTGFKNRIINGAMMIDQRYSGASANNTFGNLYVLDRWTNNGQVADKFTIRQMNSANTSASNYESGSAPTGFINSMKITTVSANATVSNTLFAPWQAIEGYNVADLDYGTANAKTVTISFWTKSSIQGTYSVVITNGPTTRAYGTTYTINQQNTWEYKTITIPGCTDGTWYKDNQAGMYLFFGLGAGSTYSVATNNTWDTTGSKYHAAGTTNLIATLGATWYITGVQLEKGSTASSFEWRPYTTELQLCQRYFQKWLSPGQIYLISGHVWSTTLCQYAMLLNPVMRGHPTLATSGTLTNLSGQSAVNLSSISLDAAASYADPGKTIKVNGNMSSSTYTSGYACAFLLNSAGAYLSLDSEL